MIKKYLFVLYYYNTFCENKRLYLSYYASDVFRFLFKRCSLMLLIFVQLLVTDNYKS